MNEVARLVAIDGPGGAGKSVFAARLAKALGGVPVVEIDDPNSEFITV
jgi:cytidylate kinase